MVHDSSTANSTEGGSIHVQVENLQAVSESGGPDTMFTPNIRTSMVKTDSSLENSGTPTKPSVRAPEQKLTLFALRLAVLEKAATGLGKLAFIWATVVLLGGFAITLSKTDFWLVTVILVIEGTRIFSRSHELEWQHQVTSSVEDAGISSFRPFVATKEHSQHVRVTKQASDSARMNIWRGGGLKAPTRVWISSDVPFLPYAKWFFRSRNISKLLLWLQIVSAIACVVLSLIKLIRHDYGEVAKGDTDKRNRKAALCIFYALALSEASLFLLEKAYWKWMLVYVKLFYEVNQECELGPTGMVSVERFFYDAYSRCVNGSIFDGLKLDMITFSMELLASDSSDEQLIGARVLRQFAASDKFSDDTLKKIGISMSVVERLVEMLNWKDIEEEEIRHSAAGILSKLAGKKQNSLRITGIPGAMESISSLLQAKRSCRSSADEIGEENIISNNAEFGIWQCNLLGLVILKKLARDPDNCEKMGNTRGLLPIIIDFTDAEERLLRTEHVTESEILTVKRSLKLLKMLARCTGTTGKNLRKEISEIVFSISNIRDILRNGEKHPGLQKLGIEILTSLGLEDDATERIGSTGGVLKELFTIFFKQVVAEDQKQLTVVAGEALAMLALESKSNCDRILRLNVLERLTEALKVPLLRVNAARILRNLCIYSGYECFNKLNAIKTAAPIILQSIMSKEIKLQEVMVGLAANAFKFMTTAESSSAFEEAGVTESDLANTVVQVLKNYKYPPINVPRIRRFAVELAIWMMRDKTSNVHIFHFLGLEKELESVLETTSELESFNAFSGVVGLNQNNVTIHSLVETAFILLVDG